MWFKQRLFNLVLWASNKFSSWPEKKRVFEALDKILSGIHDGRESKGIIIPFNCDEDRFIIFSDQHKGAKDGADDFMLCEPAYLAALDFYLQHQYRLIALGDCEELWENSLATVLKHQQPSFDRYKAFTAGQRFYKVIGNHDLDWKNDPLTATQIAGIFGEELPIFDGVLLQTTINSRTLSVLCTHGHQGDKGSDGNWFSKFFVSRIWAPLQIWLKINPNTPAYDNNLKSLHNQLMYEWSNEQHNLLLVTGHTHQPVFESLTHVERLYRQFLTARAAADAQLIKATEAEIRKRKFEYTSLAEDYLTMKPTYFNTGCCCFNDGEITGIEISEGFLRLIKWTRTGGIYERKVLEQQALALLLQSL